MIDEQKWPQTPDWKNAHLAPFEQAQLLYRGADVATVIERCQGALCYLATPYSREAVSQDGDWDQVSSIMCGHCAAIWARRFAYVLIGMQN